MYGMYNKFTHLLCVPRHTISFVHLFYIPPHFLNPLILIDILCGKIIPYGIIPKGIKYHS